MGGPPDLEPEYAHEFYVLELAEGDYVVAPRLVGVEADEAAEGVLGSIIGEGWGGCGYNVGRDVSENWMAISKKS